MPTRSEIIELDIYRNDRTGENTQKNVRKLQKIHSDALTALGKKRDIAHLCEDDEGEQIDPPPYEPEVLLIAGIHICESYENPAIYCVYDEEDHDEICPYCYHPAERK